MRPKEEESSRSHREEGRTQAQHAHESTSPMQDVYRPWGLGSESGHEGLEDGVFGCWFLTGRTAKAFKTTRDATRATTRGRPYLETASEAANKNPHHASPRGRGNEKSQDLERTSPLPLGEGKNRTLTSPEPHQRNGFVVPSYAVSGKGTWSA